MTTLVIGDWVEEAWANPAYPRRQRLVSPERSFPMAHKRSHTNGTDRLIQLARAAADDSDLDDLSDAENALADLVGRLLDRSSDRPIHRALAVLEQEQADDAADLLRFWADDAATTIDVAVSTPEGLEGGDVTLFLIPLVLATPASPLPLSIPDGPLQALTASLRTHGLPEIGAEPAIVLLGSLYRLADLPTSWAERRRWGRTIVAHLAHQLAALPPATREPTAETTASDAVSLHLRFLLGAVIASGDTVPDWDDADEDDWDDADRAAQLQAWQTEMHRILGPTFRASEMLAGFPGLWTAGLMRGLDLWHGVLGSTLLHTHLQHTGLSATDVLADVRWMGGFWRIQFVSALQTSPPWHWVVARDADTDRDLLLDLLRSFGLRRFALDERDRPPP